MKLRLVLLSLLMFCWATLPALAQIDTDLYDNGPTNGSVDAWTINFGFAVSNSFVMSDGGLAVNDVMFAAWLFPGDVLQSAEVSITSSEFGGTTFFDGNVSFTQFGCVVNQLGFNVCNEEGHIGPNGITLNQGTYWLNLQNAVVNYQSDPIYWDENSGPSLASGSSIGTIPSESFTILGGESATSTTTGGSTTPEPGSVMLFGSGILAVFGSVRRKRPR